MNQFENEYYQEEEEDHNLTYYPTKNAKNH